MKKLFSILLAAAMLLTLAPFSVRAEEGMTASDELISVLKEWEGFSRYPYWDYKQWTVGYGTSTPSDKLAEYRANGIPEAEAEALLQQHLASKGKSINSFAEKFGLKLTQTQFDALLSLSFNCGTSWLYKPSTLRTAVVEGWTGDDLIFAMGQWCDMGGKTNTGLTRRRLAEAEMYLNGVYSKTPPQEYGYVLFNPNGGETEVKVQGYVLSAEPEVRAVPTYENYTFQGWYTDPTGGELVTELDAGLKGYTLYAHWSAGNDGAQAPDEITGTPVEREVYVATGTLHSFQQPVSGALVVDAYANGELLKLTAEYTDPSGTRWGKLSKGGWINLAYTQDNAPEEEEDAEGVPVTVTATDVNLRRGPGTGYSVVGKAQKGETLEISRTQQEGGYLWGKSPKGWIALTYTDYKAPEEEKPQEPEQTPETPVEPSEPAIVGKGIVVVSSGVVNVRKGAGTHNPVVDYAYNGMEVEIYETTYVGPTCWGRFAKGWISMAFVKLEETPEEEKPQEPEQTPEEEKPQEPEQTPEEEKPQEPEQTPEEEKPQEPEQTPENKPLFGRILLSDGRLNIRSGPGTHYGVVGWYTSGAEVTVTEQKSVDGTLWGKTEKGWVSMKYVSIEEKNGSGQETAPMKGNVSSGGSQLRIRTGPGSGYAICGYLADGEAVEILQTRDVNGTKWGRVAKGWISLTYVVLAEAEPEAPTEPQQPQEPEQSKAGTVKATMLYVRSGPGTDNRIVDRLYDGESVKILETTDVNGTQWGRIENGWVCMDYIIQ